VIHHKQELIKWTVIEVSVLEEELVDVDALGVKGFEAADFGRNEALCRLFLYVTFPDWYERVQKLNLAIEAHNDGRQANMRVHVFSDEEFLIALGILIGVAEYGAKGKKLWIANGKKKEELEAWMSMIPHPYFN